MADEPLEYELKDITEPRKVTLKEERLVIQAFLNRNPKLCRLLLLLNKTGPAVISELTITLKTLINNHSYNQKTRYYLKKLSEYNLIWEGRYGDLSHMLNKEALSIAQEKFDKKCKEFPLPFQAMENNQQIMFYGISEKGKKFVSFAYNNVLKRQPGTIVKATEVK